MYHPADKVKTKYQNTLYEYNMIPYLFYKMFQLNMMHSRTHAGVLQEKTFN